MGKTILLDTGPLVAILDKRDQFNHWAESELSDLKPPFITCESVISEALFITRKFEQALDAISEMINKGLLIPKCTLQENRALIFSQLKKYNDQQTSLADICLLVLYNETKNTLIFTTDSDFLVYRDSKGKPLDLISPFRK